MVKNILKFVKQSFLDTIQNKGWRKGRTKPSPPSLPSVTSARRRNQPQKFAHV